MIKRLVIRVLTMDYIKNDTEWLIKTIEWLSSNESDGGITTCAKHKGYGFSSDCAICKRIAEIKNKAV
jgi:hypothetical protein